MIHLVALSATLLLPTVPTISVDNPQTVARNLGDKATVAQTVGRLSEGDPEALRTITHILNDRNIDIASRGWAVVALGRINSAEGAAVVQEQLHAADDPLLRTWLIAAQIKQAPTTTALAAISGANAAVFRRPMSEALKRTAANGSLAGLLTLASTQTHLQGALVAPILAQGARALIREALRHPTDGGRRAAAAYLGTLAQRQGDGEKIGVAMAKALRFTPGKSAPWTGGALFVPNINWSKTSGTLLVRELYAWMLYCENRGMSGYVRQVHNVLVSIGLTRAVGYRSGGSDATSWGRELGRALGAGTIAKIRQRVGR